MGHDALPPPKWITSATRKITSTTRCKSVRRRFPPPLPLSSSASIDRFLFCNLLFIEPFEQNQSDNGGNGKRDQGNDDPPRHGAPQSARRQPDKHQMQDQAHRNSQSQQY